MIIFPVFYSITAISCQSNPFCGINSQSKGENVNFITVLKSQFNTSNNFKVLSTPTDTNKS